MIFRHCRRPDRYNGNNLSNITIGATLDQQWPDEMWVPLGCFQEAIGVWTTVLHLRLWIFSSFCSYKVFVQCTLESVHFVIHAYYRPLVYALTQLSEKATLFESKLLNFISQFHMKYTPGINTKDLYHLEQSDHCYHVSKYQWGSSWGRSTTSLSAI